MNSSDRINHHRAGLNTTASTQGTWCKWSGRGDEGGGDTPPHHSYTILLKCNSLAFFEHKIKV